MKHLKNNSGSILVEFLVGFFVIMLCLSFALSVLPIFATKEKMDNAAEKIMRTAELKGSTSVQMKIDELKAETGLDFDVSWEGTEYIGASERVQLGNDIRLVLSTEQDIGFFEFGSFPIQVKTRQVGASERYHK